jgi:predicted aconitase with swiveling domain
MDTKHNKAEKEDGVAFEARVKRERARKSEPCVRELNGCVFLFPFGGSVTEGSYVRLSMLKRQRSA